MDPGLSGKSLHRAMSIRLISPHDVEAYSCCPQKYRSCNGDTDTMFTMSQIPGIVGEIIQILFMYRSRREFTPTWKMARLVADKTIRRTLGMPGDIGPILLPVYDWYHSYFTKYYEFEGFTNFRVFVPLDEAKGICYTDTIPVVSVDDAGPILLIFTDKKYSYRTMQYNLSFRTRLWGFWKQTGKYPEKVVVITISDKKVSTRTFFPKGEVHSLEVEYLILGLARDIYFFSRSEACNSCDFRDKCL
jgi:hypothetical protein